MIDNTLNNVCPECGDRMTAPHCENNQCFWLNCNRCRIHVDPATQKHIPFKFSKL